MKTAISIIAIACLCACASPTKQTQTNQRATAYTPDMKEFWLEESTPDKWREALKTWTDKELQNVFSSVSTQLTEREKKSNPETLFHQSLHEQAKIDLNVIAMYQAIKTEMLRRGLE